MGITVVPGPAVHKYPGATAATVHNQAIVQVGVACICCFHTGHPCQVPVEGIFFSDPAAVPFSSDKQQVEESYEAEHQANEEQLPEGRNEEPGENLG